MNVTVDIDDVYPLPRVAVLVRGLYHVQQAATLDRGDDALERHPSSLNELPVP